MIESKSKEKLFSIQNVHTYNILRIGLEIALFMLTR